MATVIDASLEVDGLYVKGLFEFYEASFRLPLEYKALSIAFLLYGIMIFVAPQTIFGWILCLTLSVVVVSLFFYLKENSGASEFTNFLKFALDLFIYWSSYFL